MRRLLAFAPALCWALIVWIVGGLEVTTATPPVPGLDKAAHFGMYGVLGWLTGRGWRRAGFTTWPGAAVLLVVAMGAADEVRQRNVPGRAAELADWFADTAGAGAGFFLAVRRARRHRENDGRDE